MSQVFVRLQLSWLKGPPPDHCAVVKGRCGAERRGLHVDFVLTEISFFHQDVRDFDCQHAGHTIFHRAILDVFLVALLLRGGR